MLEESEKASGTMSIWRRVEGYIRYSPILMGGGREKGLKTTIYESITRHFT